MSHSPGPWHAIVWGQENRFIQILRGAWDVGKDGAIADNRYSAMSWEEELDNARLIQASPEMLDLLKEVRSYFVALAVPAGDPKTNDVWNMLEMMGPKMDKMIHQAEYGELKDGASDLPYRVGSS